MNRTQFISELKVKLQGVPFDETAAAIAFYEEYFDEAGEQYEQNAIDELGSPGDVAAKIIGELAIRDIEKSPKSAKKNLSIIQLIILGIFASPIALSLALAAVIIVVFSVSFAFGVSGLSVLIAGIAVSIASLSLLFTSVSGTLLYIGTGLFMFALGCELLIFTIYISKKSFALFATLMGKFLLRRGTK